MRGESPKHPLGGKTVRLKRGLNDVGSGAVYPAGTEYHIEDAADEVAGHPWREVRTFATMNYRLRADYLGLPSDGVVFYGKIGALGYLVHESEIEP